MNYDIYVMRGNLFYLKKNYKEALENYEFLDTLAAAHALSGDFPKAIQFQNEAIRNCPENNFKNKLALIKRLVLYKTNAFLLED